MKLLVFRRFLQILKESFVSGIVLSLVVFCWIRLLLFEVPFSVGDLLNFLRVAMAGWVMIFLLRSGFELLVFAVNCLRHLRPAPRIRARWAVRTALALLITILFYSCSIGTSCIHKNPDKNKITDYPGLAIPAPVW